MKRLLPTSLFGQTLLILLAGLIVSHTIGSWIYTADREQAVRAVGGFAAAQRIANSARLVQQASLEERDRIVAGLSDQTLRVSLSRQAPTLVDVNKDEDTSKTIEDFIAQQLSGTSAARLRVVVSASDISPFASWPQMGPGRMMGHGPMMHGPSNFRGLQVAMSLSDGQWLSFATELPGNGPAFSRQFVISMAVMAIIILAVTIWVVRRVTTPLASLAAAAERLGRDVTAPPLPEIGTIETRQASRAFNDMQVRLRNLIENRTRLLAAISHDLRTPLTLLRLRAENVEDKQERDKMLATIAEMNAMVQATLHFARDETVTEPRLLTDLTSLLQSIIDDMSDAGLPVTMKPAQLLIYECRPAVLRRALTNLIENAVKYGKTAQAAITATSTAIDITIDDEGPGIPESELTRVLEPFYRIEESRSRETGGVGLGLAIALAGVQAHGGQLTLANRPSSGLRATVKLPR